MFRNSNKMKVLKHLLFLITVIVTGRADVIPERTRRDGNQLPVGEKVGDYGSSSVNPNTDAQLNAEVGENGAYKVYSLQSPNDFGGFNEAVESFGAEAKAVAGYDVEGQFNGGNVVDEYNLALPAGGFGYGNQFKAAAQASASAEVHTGEIAKNGGTAQADAITQAKLQAQFGQEAQHGAESQADAIIQEKQGVQYEGTKVQTPFQAVMPFNELMNYGSQNKGPIKYSYGPGYAELLNNPGRGIWPLFSSSSTSTEPLGGTFLGIPQVNTDSSFIYYNRPPLYQYAQPIPPSVLISETGIEKYKPTANGYEVTQSPNWIKKGFFYNYNWNPYTKPAQAETLVQAEGETQIGGKIEADALVQENGESQYREVTQANSMVQTSKEVEIAAANADAEATTYAGYGGQYNAETQLGVMAHLNSASQYKTSALADAVVQSTGGVQYSGESKLTSSVKADAEFQTNAASSYSGGSQHNGGAHYVGGSGTKEAAQTSEGIKYGAKYSQSALFADTGKHNSGSLNGQGIQAKAKSHLQSGVQFGGTVGAEAVAQASSVVETRFGQNTYPPRRPIRGFGYKHPYGWNRG